SGPSRRRNSPERALARGPGMAPGALARETACPGAGSVEPLERTRLMKQPAETCLTCCGTGDATTGGAPETCPDCFGEPRERALGRSTKLEWRLRAIESAYRNPERETAGDVLWLVAEVRKAREA